MAKTTKSAIEYDFQRQLYCVLGMPLDAVDMKTTVSTILSSAKSGTPCFLSTPNLNFFIQTLNDFSFTQSIIQSDLSIADGQPICWIARALGIPVKERVAGSSLFEELMNRKGNEPLKVFFFGGQEDIAKQAMKIVNEHHGNMVCSGALNPGMGNIEDMSTPEILNSINNSNAEFIVVSLGAKKGQSWIMKNQEKLDAPIVSHLGAVVNFIAGSVERAPQWVQGIGMEWLWRIKEEPSLWKRYWLDGISLTKTVCLDLTPYLLYRAKAKRSDKFLEPLECKIEKASSTTIVRLKGAVKKTALDVYRQQFAELVSQTKGNVFIDLSEAHYIDEACLGLITLFEKHLGDRFGIVEASPETLKALRFNHMGRLLRAEKFA